MSWQVVKERELERRAAAEPEIYVSLNRRGEIALNKHAFAAIREPYNVTLLYDPEARTIGVKFPVALDGNFFAAQPYGRGRRMRIVRAARLLKQFDIEVTRTLAFRDVRVEDLRPGEPMLVLDLDEGEPILKSHNAPRPA